MKILSALCFFLYLSSIALAVTVETINEHTINTQVASSNYTSSSINTSNSSSGSIHCVWASLTGTLDGQFITEVSSDGGTSWVAKSAAVITVSGASSSDLISLNNVVTEDKYRIRYAHNNVSGGTINCYSVFKG